MICRSCLVFYRGLAVTFTRSTLSNDGKDTNMWASMARGGFLARWTPRFGLVQQGFRESTTTKRCALRPGAIMKHGPAEHATGSERISSDLAGYGDIVFDWCRVTTYN